jgi:hypothetical protein
MVLSSNVKKLKEVTLGLIEQHSPNIRRELTEFARSNKIDI